MPRFAKRRSSGRKRPTKWCAATINMGVPKHDLLAVADATPLCAQTGGLQDVQDIVIGPVRGQLSITRIQKDDDDNVIAWAIVLCRLEAGDTVPVQVFDPFAVIDLERQDILGMGIIPCPAIVLNSTNVAVVSQESTVVDIVVKSSRKLQRNTNNLFLWVASSAGAGAGTDNAFRVQGSLRTIMKFG